MSQRAKAANTRYGSVLQSIRTAFVTSLVFSCGPIAANGADYLSETAHLLTAKGKILPRLPEGLGYHAASLLAREFFQVFGSNRIHVLCRNLPRGYMSDRGAMAKGTLVRDGEGATMRSFITWPFWARSAQKPLVLIGCWYPVILEERRDISISA